VETRKEMDHIDHQMEHKDHQMDHKDHQMDHNQVPQDPLEDLEDPQDSQDPQKASETIMAAKDRKLTRDELEILKIAGRLSEPLLKQIFKPEFLKRADKNVGKIQLVENEDNIPKRKDLVVNRCNFPQTFTMRTKLLGRGKTGSAPCRRRVKLGHYFCGLQHHQKFAHLCSLPISVDEKNDGQSSPNDPVDIRLPHVRTAYVINGILVKLDKEKILSMPVPVDMSQGMPQGMPPLGKKQGKTQVKKKTKRAEQKEEECSVFPHFTCIYDDPYTGHQCMENGVYDDPECPGAKLCEKHTFPDDTLIKQAMLQDDPERVATLQQIRVIDDILLDPPSSSSSLENKKDEDRSRLAQKRFMLASDMGLGTPLQILNMFLEEHSKDPPLQSYQ
jgi:hypothetical protein